VIGEQQRCGGDLLGGTAQWPKERSGMPHVPERRRATLVFLVDPAGRLLLQLRDAHAPVGANQWSVPGGGVEAGEEPEAGARREVLEETGLQVAGPLVLFWQRTRPSSLQLGALTDWFVYCAPTTAYDEDVIVGEGAAMKFVPPEQARRLDLATNAAYFLPLFLDSALCGGLLVRR
jgi:8-oxo-dGTP diphosphatase